MLNDLTDLPEDRAEVTALFGMMANEIKSQALEIEQLKLQLSKQRQHRFGSSSEALDQLKLGFEELELAASTELSPKQTEEECSGHKEAKDKPKRKPLPDHLERQEQRLYVEGDCPDCGGSLKTVGEDVTEELEYVPGRFVVNRIVRPRKACSCCESFVQAPLPSRPIERGRPGPGLLAHVLVSKYADHLPLYRQSEIYGRDGLDISRSTMADWVGKSATLLEPLANKLRDHVLAGQAIFADDTPVNMLAPKAGKTKKARLWTYVRDERPWAGEAPPAVWYQFSLDRKGIRPKEHLVNYSGWMHADGYAGFEELYRGDKIKEVACMAHVRRKFVDLHKANGLDVAEEAIKRIAALYAIEKEVRGSPPDKRVELRQSKANPIFDDLEVWLDAQLAKISGKSQLAKDIRYALNRMNRMRSYLDHGFLELDNNAAERSIRPIALGRKNYLFMGSEKGGKAAAIIYSLIETAKLNDVDPQAWLAFVLGHIADQKVTELDELMPWIFRNNGGTGFV